MNTHWLHAVSGAAILLLASPWLNSSQAQSITRIEEDWSVSVIEPDSGLNAPQLTTVLTPNSQESGIYFTFELNHSTAPDFVGGGLQLQGWRGDQRKSYSPRLSEAALDLNDERMKWTQYVEIDSNNKLNFGITNFISSTWSIDESVAQVGLVDYGHNELNNYRIADSTTYSAVGYSGNRIAEMVLVEVRAYSGTQLVAKYSVNQDVNSR